MKLSIELQKATRLINPGEIILVSCSYKDSANITTCAWHMPLSKEPPLLGIALAKSHFSSELIKKSKEFVVNIPDWSILDKVIICGSCSGRNINKFEKTKLTPQVSNKLKVALKIKDCLGNIECSLFDTKEFGDHFLFVGQILYAEAEKEFFVNDFWNTKKIDLIFHLGSKFFFKSSSYYNY